MACSVPRNARHLSENYLPTILGKMWPSTIEMSVLKS
jgi:hypothetical protein